LFLPSFVAVFLVSLFFVFDFMAGFLVFLVFIFYKSEILIVHLVIRALSKAARTKNWGNRRCGEKTRGRLENF